MPWKLLVAAYPEATLSVEQLVDSLPAVDVDDVVVCVDVVDVVVCGLPAFATGAGTANINRDKVARVNTVNPRLRDSEFILFVSQSSTSLY